MYTHIKGLLFGIAPPTVIPTFLSPLISRRDPSWEACRRVFLDSPILCPRRYNALFGLEADGISDVLWHGSLC